MRNPLRAMLTGHHNARATSAAQEMWRHVQHINGDSPIAAIIVGADGTWGTPLKLPTDTKARRELEVGLAAIHAAGQE